MKRWSLLIDKIDLILGFMFLRTLRNWLEKGGWMKEFPAILLIVCIEFTSVVLYGVARSVIESPSFVPNISALLYTVLAVKVSNIISFKFFFFFFFLFFSCSCCCFLSFGYRHNLLQLIWYGDECLTFNWVMENSAYDFING